MKQRVRVGWTRALQLGRVGQGDLHGHLLNGRVGIEKLMLKFMWLCPMRQCGTPALQQ
jgi:hypothetical protein